MYRDLEGDHNAGEASVNAASDWDPRLTEARNPRTERIDLADAETIVRTIQAEDRAVGPAVESQASAIARLIEDVAARFRLGGRLVYAGAGTSGRLGVLDATECPPTFGVEPGRVRGIIAGGPSALVESSEGAEDDADAGAAAVAELDVGSRDLVMGIATSGTTPFVHGALAEAKGRGAATALLSCSPPPAAVRALAQHLVTPLVGPEVVTGSTRMKAGTATKIVLNTITTGAMIRSGRVYRNLMVDLRARSAKLVDRGLRIVEHVTGRDREAARALLLSAGGEVKVALAMHALPADRWTAERCLDAANGFLGQAIDAFAGRARPEYGVYPRAPGEGGGSRLLERLAAAPSRLAAAAERASRERESTAGVRLHPWSAAQHAAHLADFEEDAIAPRAARWVAPRPGGEVPSFEEWEQEGAPRATGLAEELGRFERARGATMASLEEADPDALLLEGRFASESVTLYQFLRGVDTHDAAHERRIVERVHPALTGS
ncbi:MAG: N-acetylmuramic acid 6-phosphate etherase [Gemmatimonadota bacterium]|nr:N-acetylmuramic acid 6-phosphate etherase [Gemmatimonadota bacterium]